VVSTQVTSTHDPKKPNKWYSAYYTHSSFRLIVFILLLSLVRPITFTMEGREGGREGGKVGREGGRRKGG
jgi:hypothetical protein